MKFHLSLGKKGLILIAVPLTFQFVMVGMLAQLYFAEKTLVRQKDDSRKVLAELASVEREVMFVYDLVDSAPKDPPYKLKDDFHELAVRKKNVGDILSRLKSLVKGKPEEEAIVNRAGSAFSTVLKEFGNVNLLIEAGSLHDNETRKQFMKSFRAKLAEFKEMPALGDKEAVFLDKIAPPAEERLREQFLGVLVGGAIMTFALGIATFAIFSLRVAKRLDLMLDNTFSLAAGKPLHPILRGHDEIAILDQNFHSMAEALEEVSSKNRAMIENARDVMFSLDKHGTFLSVSPASQSVLGFAPDDLIGSKMIGIVVKADSKHVLESLRHVMDGGDQHVFECRVQRRDGRDIDMRCSVHWVRVEQTIFCQAYDITESKQAERLRQEILQMVSHDLKTPLSTVRSFLEMLNEGMFGEINDRGRRLMKLADNSTSRMLTLIRDLLEIERMEAGMLQLQVSDQQLAELFEQAAGSVASQALEYGVQLVCGPCAYTVRVDPDRVIQVLTNLLSNAIKFSPKGAAVALSAQEIDGRIEVRVRDRGRGIPAEKVDYIFDRFSQVKASDATEKGGSGLGLAICKALVELHGGKIRAESTENEGSTFIFTLPKSEVTAAISNSMR